MSSRDRAFNLALNALAVVLLGTIAACSDTLQSTAPARSPSASSARTIAQTTVDGHHYQFVPGAFTWAEAKAGAEAMGGHLAIITSAGEQAEIVQLARDVGLEENQYWIGGYHPGDESALCGWSWLDGTPIPVDRAGACFTAGYSNWHYANPSGDLHGMSFLWYPSDEYQVGTWNDAPEYFGFGYLVEFEVVTPEQAVANVVAGVSNLAAGGAIPSDAVAPLTSSLDAVAASLQNGNTKAALGQLGAFDNKVDALLKSGRITAATAAQLSDMSNRVRKSL